MSFANHNILDIALSLIPPTVVQIRKNLNTNDNAYGQVSAAYSEWVDVYGIVQPGGESNEHTNGIDYSKKRVSIWLRGVDLTGTHIQEAPDQIRYVGRIYNVVDVDDWFPYDNYRKCDCVEAVNLPEDQKKPTTGKKKQTGKKKKKQQEQNPADTTGDLFADLPDAEPSLFVQDEPQKQECAATPPQAELHTEQEIQPVKPPKKPVIRI